mmetsp:Transcript_17534/g.44167  ORF Transcript_17534/g.44167 Transcript_17534/m.44167 type:complete len:239 (-) Transcript_17534:437-1153(-)
MAHVLSCTPCASDAPAAGALASRASLACFDTSAMSALAWLMLASTAARMAGYTPTSCPGARPTNSLTHFSAVRRVNSSPHPAAPTSVAAMGGKSTHGLAPTSDRNSMSALCAATRISRAPSPRQPSSPSSSAGRCDSRSRSGTLSSTVIQEMRNWRHLGDDTGAASSARRRGTNAGMLKSAGDAATMSLTRLSRKVTAFCTLGSGSAHSLNSASNTSLKKSRNDSRATLATLYSASHA